MFPIERGVPARDYEHASVWRMETGPRNTVPSRPGPFLSDRRISAVVVPFRPFYEVVLVSLQHVQYRDAPAAARATPSVPDDGSHHTPDCRSCESRRRSRGKRAGPMIEPCLSPFNMNCREHSHQNGGDHKADPNRFERPPSRGRAIQSSVGSIIVAEIVPPSSRIVFPPDRRERRPDNVLSIVSLHRSGFQPRPKQASL